MALTTCEHITIHPTRPQKSWRTAWRKIIAETARRAGREAAQEALDARATIAAWKRAASPFRDFRFHDLRHQAITEIAEAGVSEATLMAVLGHTSRHMFEQPTVTCGWPRNARFWTNRKAV